MSTDFSSFYGIYSGACRGTKPFKRVEENILQETAGNPTPRPQQSPYYGPYDDTTSAATKNQAIHQADPTSNNDSRIPRHGLSDAGLSPSSYSGLPLQVHQVVTRHDTERDVAGLQSHSGYPSDDDPELWFTRLVQELQLEAPRDDPRDEIVWSLLSVHRETIQCGTQSAGGSPPNSIPSTVFHNTFPQSFSHPVPETPQGGTTSGVTQHQTTFPMANDHPVPANDQVPVSPTDGRRLISACGWDDGGGPCGINVHKDRIAEHMTSFHIKPRLGSKSAVKCQWKGCTKKEALRRDTIFRHISEKHYRIRRSKSGKRRDISH